MGCPNRRGLYAASRSAFRSSSARKGDHDLLGHRASMARSVESRGAISGASISATKEHRRRAVTHLLSWLCYLCVVAEFALREWQVAALREWRRAWRGCVEVATGGGKTIFAIACWRDLLRSGNPCQIVVIVPTTALADQWHVTMIEDAGLDEEDIVHLRSGFGGSPEAKCVIGVINTAREVDPRVWTAPRFLVVDECHRAGSEQNSRALRGDTLASLGLSATPERQYDDGFETRVVPRLGHVVYKYDVAEAVADSVLSPFHLVNVRVPMLDEEQQRYDQLSRRIAMLTSRRDSPDDQGKIEALLRQRSSVSNNAQMRIPVAVNLLNARRGERAMVFHESIDRAEEIVALLRDRGHSAVAYHSRVGASLRRERLRQFRKGMVDTLVTCRALDEGANIPEVRIAVVVAATASARQRVQRLGRVLRPAPGKSVAEVLTLYASDVEERRLQQESKSLEGVVGVEWAHARTTA